MTVPAHLRHLITVGRRTVTWEQFAGIFPEQAAAWSLGHAGFHPVVHYPHPIVEDARCGPDPSDPWIIHREGACRCHTWDWTRGAWIPWIVK